MVLDVIYNLSPIVMEIWCFILFLDIFANRKKSMEKIFYLFFVFQAVEIVFFSTIFSDQFLLKQMGIIACGTLIVYIIYEIKITRALILYMIFQAVGLVVDSGVLLGLFLLIPSLAEKIKTSYYISLLLSLSARVILFLVIMVLRNKFQKKKINMLTSIEWIRFLMFPLYTVIAIVAIVVNWEFIENPKQDNTLLFIAVGLALMNFIMLSLINDALKREKQIREDNIFQLKMSNETKMYHTFLENYECQRKQAHEYKNKINCIIGLSKGKEYEKLNEYLALLGGELSEEQYQIDVGHAIINAILNTKYQEAKNKNITITWKLMDLSNILIEEGDLVVLLSNMLNNAIEACEKCTEKHIWFKFIMDEDCCIISCINTMKEKPQVLNGLIRTSKNSSLDHGFGIQNMMEVVEKYHGQYVIDTENHKFQITVKLNIENIIEFNEKNKK